jgi:hypothetical protein
MLDDIPDDVVSRVRGSSPISAPEAGQEDSPKVDSGASSIAKSKAVKPEIVPPMEAPLLMAPTNQENVAFAVTSIDSSGFPVVNTLQSFILKEDEIKDSVLKGWMNNLREIEEYVRQLLASPMYQQLQEIRQKANSQSDTVSNVQGVSPASAAQSGHVEFLSTLDRLQVLERVPPSAEVQDTSAPGDASRVLVIPLTAALLAGGVVMGSEVAHSANPVSGAIELVERLQPLFPTVSVQDLVPLINLMVAGPIYFNSWNEAVSNIQKQGRHSHVQAIQNFAKDVIKIVTDPHFVNHTLIQKMKGTESLSSKDQDRLARMLKVILIGVALSLLYSVEVGKVQNGKFGGIEPEELRELLLGKFNETPSANKKMSEQEELTTSLIARAWEQLKPLPVEDRTAAVEALLDYMTKNRDLDPMLDPARVFEDTIAASHFDPKEKRGIVKA